MTKLNLDVVQAIRLVVNKIGDNSSVTKSRLNFDSTNFDITNPAVRFRQVDALSTGDDAEGLLLEWGGDMTAGVNYPYGQATNAYVVNPASTFQVPSSGYKKWGRMIMHYQSPDSTGEIVQQHLKFETVKADYSSLLTRFQISFGEDIALASFLNSNVKIYSDRYLQIGTDTAGAKIKHDTTLNEITVYSPQTNIRWNWKDSTIRMFSGLSGAIGLEARVGIDTISRFNISTSGRMEWGTGSATRDVSLYRNGADQLRTDDVFMPQQAATASAPPYVKGGFYFDTTLNKMRVGGATGWETITSS